MATRFLETQFELSRFDEQSFGLQARLLWEQKFAHLSEIEPGDIQILHTGIGDALGSESSGIRMFHFWDGSVVPTRVDTRTVFQRPPKMLFIIASIPTAYDVLALGGVARTYKEQGVETIIPIVSGLAHERQDHQFIDETGAPMHQVTMLKDVIRYLASEETIGDKRVPCIDGMLMIQPHSLRPVELGLRDGLPILPFDALDFLDDAANLSSIENAYVVGPDKGRKDESRRLAAKHGWPIAAATKVRARSKDGYPSVSIPDEAKEYMRKNRSKVIVYDDEGREGGTIEQIAEELSDQEIVVILVKGILAHSPDGETSAVKRLDKPNITRIVMTDAVRPQTDTTPLAGKLEIIPLAPEMFKLAAYLQRNLVKPNDPLWLDSTQTGTLLRLDLTVEEILQ